jgi:hypothetical protein
MVSRSPEMGIFPILRHRRNWRSFGARSRANGADDVSVLRAREDL